MTENILTQLQRAQSDEEREWLVLQFSLEGLEPAVLEMAWAAAIPHWFDEKFLAAILGIEELPSWQNLISLSFVEVFPGRGFNVHERSRKLLVERLWEDDRERYRTWSAQAATHCQHQDQLDSNWRIETIYHQLSVDEATATQMFRRQASEWQDPPNFAYGQVESLVRVVLEVVEAKFLTGEAATWGYYFQAQLDIIYGRTRNAKQSLEKSLHYQINSSILYASIIKLLGDVHVMLAEYKLAQEKYDIALSIFQSGNHAYEEAETLQALGTVWFYLTGLKLARNHLTLALDIHKKNNEKFGEACCLKILGDISLDIYETTTGGEYYVNAKILCNRVKNASQIEGHKLREADCLKLLGDIHMKLAEAQEPFPELYDQAQSYYEQAKQIYQSIGRLYQEQSCLKGLANVSRCMKDWKGAKEKYDEVIKFEEKAELVRETAFSLYYLGIIAEGEKEHSQAREYYQSALGIFSTIEALKLVQEIQNALERLRF